jgi:hypothetical protein
LSQLTRAQRSHYRPDQPNGDGKPLALRSQAIEPDQRIDGAGDHNGVEAEEQAAQRSGQGRFHEIEVGAHPARLLDFQPSYKLAPAWANPLCENAKGTLFLGINSRRSIQMQVRRNFRFRSAFVAALLAMAAGLCAQTPAAPAAPILNWKTYSYPNFGFRVSFPVDPKLDEKKQEAPQGTILFTSYCAQVANTNLCAAVIDQGPEATGLTPDVLLGRIKMGLELAPKTKTLHEKEIELDGHKGVEVETENESLHITTRIYWVDNTLYQTMATVPLTDTFSGTGRFLDSFRLIQRSKN